MNVPALAAWRAARRDPDDRRERGLEQAGHDPLRGVEAPARRVEHDDDGRRGVILGARDGLLDVAGHHVVDDPGRETTYTGAVGSPAGAGIGLGSAAGSTTVRPRAAAMTQAIHVATRKRQRRATNRNERVDGSMRCSRAVSRVPSETGGDHEPPAVSAGEEFPEDGLELVPLDQERVVALGRARSRGSGRRPRPSTRRRPARGPGAARTGCRPRCRRRSAASRRRRARPSAAIEPAPAGADVVAVHRPRQDPVRGRVEPIDELAALVVEVADDRRPAVGLDRRARSARRSRPRSGTWSSPAARASARPSRPSRSMSSTWRWFQAIGHRPGRGRRRDRHRRARTGLGPQQGDLEGDHAAQRAADDEGDVARSPSASSRRHWARAWSRVVTAGNAAPYGRPVARVDRGRAGRPVAAAEQVGAQDADPVRVERPARADERRPPVAGGVGRAGQGVDDEDLRRVARGRTVVAVGDGQLGQRLPVVQLERPELDATRAGRSRSGERPSRGGAPTASRPVVRTPGHPAAPTSSPSADASAVAAASAWLEVGDEVVDVLEPDRQPDEVRRSRRSRPAPPARAASASSTPDG